MVLAGVAMLLLVLTIAATTFIERATVDALIAANRDYAARADALARGGVQLSTALLLQDRLDKQDSGMPVATRDDLWARVRGLEIAVPDGGTLELAIEDAGSRLDLNALFADGAPRDALTEIYLIELLDKLILDMDVPVQEKSYEPRDLAQNLIDWIDADDVRLRGGPEDAYYLEQTPPYRAANRPLLSVDELRLVEGFDARLVEALRPYVSVHPLVGGDGVNPNTAPSYVLAALFHGTAGDQRLASEDLVRRILDIRSRGVILCPEQVNVPGCQPVLGEIPGQIYPPPTWESDVFHVTATATYGNVRRTVEAVIDREDPSAPGILDWRVR